jgi:hypothetical protein
VNLMRENQLTKTAIDVSRAELNLGEIESAQVNFANFLKAWPVCSSLPGAVKVAVLKRPADSQQELEVECDGSTRHMKHSQRIATLSTCLL